MNFTKIAFAVCVLILLASVIGFIKPLAENPKFWTYTGLFIGLFGAVIFGTSLSEKSKP